MAKKITVVLMNLGGPDSLKAVKPFLYKLFSDPRIITLPSPFRQVLAWVISCFRTGKAIKIYERIGGKSPILENTLAQAEAIQRGLEEQDKENTYQVVVAMRYWYPLTEETIQKVMNFNPEKIVLLPLYPQFSTTTTESSLVKWSNIYTGKQETKVICCYPREGGFIHAYQDIILKELEKSPSHVSVRLLFSAHGLPQKIVDAGDPYPIQVAQSIASIMDHPMLRSLDYQTCYQSRVGLLKWLGPSLDEAMVRASKDGMGVIVVPVSFVSEHSETLVELDMDFRDRASELKILYYSRVPTVSTHPEFIQGLVNLIISGDIVSKSCAADISKCWCAVNPLSPLKN